VKLVKQSSLRVFFFLAIWEFSSKAVGLLILSVIFYYKLVLQDLVGFMNDCLKKAKASVFRKRFSFDFISGLICTFHCMKRFFKVTKN
jgi:hypothetical protein